MILIGDLIISMILIIFAFYMFIEAGNFKMVASSAKSLGAAFWPKIILILLLILSCIQFLTILKKWRLENKKSLLPPLKVLGRSVLILLCYIISINKLGFLFSTIVFQFVFLYNLGIRKLSYLVTTPIVITGFLYLFFIKIMYIPLPRGLGLFRDLSLLFY